MGKGNPYRLNTMSHEALAVISETPSPVCFRVLTVGVTLNIYSFDSASFAATRNFVNDLDVVSNNDGGLTCEHF